MCEVRNCPSVPDQLATTISVMTNGDWRKPIIQFLQSGIVLSKIDLVGKRAARFLIIDENLFKKGYKLPYLKCLGPTDAYNTLREIHEEVCGNHIDSRTLAHKALREGYYWPTMEKDPKTW